MLNHTPFKRVWTAQSIDDCKVWVLSSRVYGFSGLAIVGLCGNVLVSLPVLWA